MGSIFLGYAQAKESPSFDAGREAFVNAAAALANQMLERRADQVQLDRLRTELRRRQIMLAQTQRFAKVGYWEYETASGEFTWSDEVRQMAGMDAEGKAGREAEKLIAKRMQEAVDEAMRTHRPLVCEFTVTLAGK